MSWDGTIKLWEVESGGVCQTLAGHTDRVNRVVWSPDGRTLASCGRDTTIWLWDVEQNRSRTVLQGHRAATAHDLFFSQGGRGSQAQSATAYT